jgi:hypothetical protein
MEVVVEGGLLEVVFDVIVRVCEDDVTTVEELVLEVGVALDVVDVDATEV